MKQDLLGAVKLLDYESCCTEKWLVSYFDTNQKTFGPVSYFGYRPFFHGKEFLL